MSDILLDWLNVFSTIIGVVSFWFFLAERRERKEQEAKRLLQKEFMLGFLHGLKPIVESVSQHGSVTGSELAPVIPQINDAIARLNR